MEPVDVHRQGAGSDDRRKVRSAVEWILELVCVLSAVAAGTVIGDLALHL